MEKEINNVTTRTYRRQISDDSVNHSFISTLSDQRARSLPDLSSVDITDDDLHNENTNLKSQLSSAHNEIEELSLKVRVLEKENEEKQSKINQLKQFCTAPLSSVRKNKKMCRTSQHKINTSVIDLGLSEETDKTFIEEPRSSAPKKEAILESSDKASQTTSSSQEGATSTKATDDSAAKPKLLIYGTQQCAGLASILTLFRQDFCSKYEDFDIFACTKPFATSEDILGDLQKNPHLNVERDQIVLCVGENDRNPGKLLYELSGVFKRLEKCNIIVINVHNNRFLNNDKLNNMIKTLTKYVPNCDFITIEKSNLTNLHYLLELSKQISFIVDCRFYNNNYLNVDKIRNHLHCDNNNVNSLKMPAKKKQLVQTTLRRYFENQMAKSEVDDNNQIKTQPKKTTLLDYYSVIDKNTKVQSRRECSD